MYLTLLDDLVRFHDSLETKNRFKNSLIPYREDSPAFIIGDDYKVFSIENCDYCVEIDNHQLESDKVKKLSSPQTIAFKFAETCMFCADNINRGICYVSNSYCCLQCSQFHQFGTVGSKFPILNDYNLSRQGFMILEKMNYFLNNNKLILSYYYHDQTISLEIRYLKYITEGNGFRCLENLIKPIVHINPMLSMCSNCLCKQGCIVDMKGKMIRCTACPFVFLKRLAMIHAIKFSYLDCFTELNQDMIIMIKEMLLKNISSS